MKTFVVALVLTVCAAAQAASISRYPAITRLDYHKTNKDGRIIDGEPASQGQFPWQVAITINYSGRSSLCGGSLISPSWVLTAGHCVDGGVSWDIKAGGIHRNVSNEPGSVVVSSIDSIPHENYSSWTLFNDIALIRLNEEVPLSDNIQPIRLPGLSEVDDPLENITVTVSGWGQTDDLGPTSENLNWVNLNTITNEECREVYGSVADTVVCCRGNPNHNTCTGDSGGPLIRFDADGQPTQVGVVSYGHFTGCTKGYPTGYTRTASFLTWINDQTGIPLRE